MFEALQQEISSSQKQIEYSLSGTEPFPTHSFIHKLRNHSRHAPVLPTVAGCRPFSFDDLCGNTAVQPAPSGRKNSKPGAAGDHGLDPKTRRFYVTHGPQEPEGWSGIYQFLLYPGAADFRYLERFVY